MRFYFTSFIISVMAVLAVGCDTLSEPTDPIVFVSKQSLPTGRASASSFVADGKAYVLCGRS
ncbi:MAG TPA: hypothetical protein VJ856_02845, partial [Paludibacteraceae bacterium]|nr:hypothetical protein [Paludibacteraceae bacterium]